MGIMDSISHSFKTLRIANQLARKGDDWNIGSGYGRPSHKNTMHPVDTSSLSKVVFNRIATDAAMIPILHVKTNSANQTEKVIDSELQKRFSIEANIDQSAFQFFHELVYSMCDEEAIAVVPTETRKKLSMDSPGVFDIYSWRIGRITQWYPKHVEVDLYNEDKGVNERVRLPKNAVAILENPFGEVLNRQNGTLSRLKRKMALLDLRDEEISAGKLNMFIQLPYALKGKTRREQAEARRAELEKSLKDNAYGVAYVGNDEKITQLNHPIDNDLADQVKYLRNEFYSQLGLTENIFNGTANELEMNNYYTRAIEPVLTPIVQEFKRKFLTKTARSQGQDIIYLRDPFKLIPAEQLANIADTFTRNSIASPNEIRKIVGLLRSHDPQADELYNRNIADVNQEGTAIPSQVAEAQAMEVPSSDPPASLHEAYFK